MSKRCNFDDDDAYEYAEIDNVIYEDDRIRTKEESGAILGLEDMTTYEMKPESILIIHTEENNTSKLEMVVGSIVGNIKKMWEGKSIELEMSHCVAGIKGTIVTYIGVAVGFFTTFFVLTRFLTAGEIGLARVLLDAATLFVGLAQLGTTSSIIRFFPYFTKDGRTHGFFFWSLIVPLAGFAVFALVFLAFRTPVEAWFGEKSPLFVDYWYFVLPIAFFMLYQTVFETCSNVCMRIVVPRAVREGNHLLRK